MNMVGKTYHDMSNIGPNESFSISGRLYQGLGYDLLLKEIITTGSWELSVAIDSTELLLDSGASGETLKDLLLYSPSYMIYKIKNTDVENYKMVFCNGTYIYEKLTHSNEGIPALGSLMTIEAGQSLSMQTPTLGYESVAPTIFHEGACDIIYTDGGTPVVRESLTSDNKMDKISPLRSTNVMWYEIKNTEATSKIIGYCGAATSQFEAYSGGGQQA